MGDEEKSERGKSFLREAAILTVANFAVKIIGVVFKIPLTNIMGTSIGVFTAAYSIYAMLFMLSTSGLPVAISRLVSASNERGRGREAERISTISTFIFGIIGFAFMLVLIIFAPSIAKASGHEESALAMRVIAPSLFFICVCASVRGFYQGLRNMYPTAISQFIEAFFKLAVGLIAVIIASKLGAGVEVQAACAISGVTAGTMLATIFILIFRKVSKKSRLKRSDNRVRSDKQLAKNILLIAFPITLTAAAIYFSQFFDTIVIVNCLVGSGEQAETAETLYAAYTGLSVPVYDLLPSALVFPIATSILPAVSGALAVRKNSKASYLTNQAIRISGIIAFPCGALLFVAGRSCITLLYGVSKWAEPVAMANGSAVLPIDFASTALSVLAVAVFFISIVSTTNSLLNAYGKPHMCFISALAGVAALVVSEIALIYSPVGVYGAPISSIICYLVATIMNIGYLRKHCGVKLKLSGMFARPFLCSIVSACVTYAAYAGSSAAWRAWIGTSTDTRVASFCILLVSGVVLVISYCAATLLLGGIKENEVRLLPKGELLADKLIKKGWLKPEAKKAVTQ